MDKRAYINPKEMDFISYVLNSNSEFKHDQINLQKDRVLTRLKTIQPLITECINKNLDLKIICNDLNNEYNDLIFIQRKHNIF
jgi:hypothetical protein